MNNIKSVFSIKDLENLSGIKAHTIRIWEKRYNILEPMRTGTNIRMYDSLSLQKLLNITLLHNHGYKISKISNYNASKISELAKEIINEKSAKNHAVSAFKMAMMNFDQTLFTTTYNELLSKKTFKDVFSEVFIPLMEEIGLLWQTETITPAHEHFISHLVKQKILVNTEAIQSTTPIHEDTVFVLFLPSNEIHELGLLYLNYVIIRQGYKTIYLSESIPMDNLKDMTNYFDSICFLTYMTVEPDKDKINDYIKEFDQDILSATNSKLWICGRLTNYIEEPLLNSSIKVFNSLFEVLTEI
ncbi:MerR family transcriptional regulator [Flavobacterium sp. H122]|uniref:MerR family transcriptional regulator n=1 Tax=Flavobacterium sp. H122 TaxID=2529860 RepID=UPI0010A9EC5A|nr:MerR family transcriptional regulator [Flavobacterium sp. H122]